MGCGITNNSTTFLLTGAESVQRNSHYSGSIDANQLNGYMVILSSNKT